MLPFALILTLLFAPQSAMPSQEARQLLYQGIRAMRAGDFDQAIRSLEKAVEVDPESDQSIRYLAYAHQNRYAPGDPNPANQAHARAIQECFKKLLILDPNDRLALSSLAQFYLNEAFTAKLPAERTAQLDEAARWYRDLLEIDPQAKEAVFSLGVIEWQRIQFAQQQQRDPAVLHTQTEPSFTAAIDRMQQALKIDPRYTDAMAYLQMIYRARADLATDPEAAAKDRAEAERWADRVSAGRRVRQSTP